MYRILLNATACVQPVSCDEAYLDVTGLGDPEEVAESIRQQIFDATGCTASAGIGPNMLVARLATKKGKPNGQFRIETSQVRLFTSATAGFVLQIAAVLSQMRHAMSESHGLGTEHIQPSQPLRFVTTLPVKAWLPQPPSPQPPCPSCLGCLCSHCRWMPICWISR